MSNTKSLSGDKYDSVTYNRENTKMYAFRVVLATEQDVIQKLDSVPNKSSYIKKLIRADIAQDSNGDVAPNSQFEISRLILGLRSAGWDDAAITDFLLWLATGEEQYRPTASKN